MIYRLVTVWRDAEEPDSPIMRSACDYATQRDAETHIVAVSAAGIARFDVTAERMENGARLLATVVPMSRVVGWFIWELPDDTPMWSVGGVHSG